MGYLWPILVFLGLSVLDLGPMYATDRRETSEKSIALCPRSTCHAHNPARLGSSVLEIFGISAQTV